MPAEIDGLSARFPKTRPELPEAYRAIYADHYRRNREGLSPASAITRKMESWMHHMVARDVVHQSGSTRTLEVGAGNLNHLQFEPSSSTYDVVEELNELCVQSPSYSQVRNVYKNLDDISGESYDRIISVAALEHYVDLPAVVAKCAGLLAPGGALRIAVPSEGTLLWKLGWMLTSGIDFRVRYGLSYGTLMRYEHVNTAAEIEEVLSGFFAEVRRSVFGIGPSLSFYQFFECRSPILD